MAILFDTAVGELRIESAALLLASTLTGFSRRRASNSSKFVSIICIAASVSSAERVGTA